ncbi:cation:proton antiporter [Salinimicrobium sp. MT39]|uniref:Cation:proton antiporter n=1 Tax=Salinimicrobium profundisediminis TaxID=2994553 RepID=A0A9X3CU47_9FLAO|nr:cation:proton antiporter [Salinimicrobium profundisediminis]MCX2836882.1 cation:proton antiporter [Salinimicrobium profundisediminis]
MDAMTIIFFISLLIILVGAFFKKIQNVSITEPLLALSLGVILGPAVLNLIQIIDSPTQFYILEVACQFTIAMALMATALRLPSHIFRKNATTLSILVIFGMLLMWVLASGVFYLLMPNLNIFECLLLGAIITPTDPVVASTLITGQKAQKFLPAKLRNTLSFEAGVNDGLAFPIVFLALYLLNAEGSGDLGQWFVKVLWYESILCAILAYGVGYGCGYLLKKTHKAGYLNHKTLLSFSIAVALLLLSGFELLQMNPIIAVFAGALLLQKILLQMKISNKREFRRLWKGSPPFPYFLFWGSCCPGRTGMPWAGPRC